MKTKQAHRPMKPIEAHRRWLAAMETEGPFLAARALVKAWPSGMPPLAGDERRRLTLATSEFERAWDAWDAKPETALDDYRQARDAFVDVVLRDVVGWGEAWQRGVEDEIDAEVTSPRGDVSVRPDGVARAGGRVGALVHVVDPVQGSLADPGLDGWSQSAIDRMELMLRRADVRIGVVTDGRRWALVSVPAKDGGMPSSGETDALTWSSETGVRDAFVGLLSRSSLFNTKLVSYLPDVFVASQVAAEEITEALGVQVRKAVELLVAALDESGRRADGSNPLPDDGDVIYEAVVTVVMRVVFLLFAEERGLLPQSELYRRAYGLAGQLDELVRQEAETGSDSLDRTFLVWHRLLATSTALFGGVNFEDLRLPAYGGSLFDPARFPFLTAPTEAGTLALGVSDLVMLHVLRSVQETEIKGEGRRRVSFRDIDVEQIGYVYESLLGYTCRRAVTTTLGLIGPDGAEPEVPLDVLDELYEETGSDAATSTAIAAWVKKNQPAAKSATTSRMTKALAAGDSAEVAEPALRRVTDDPELRERLRGWLGIIRRDLRGKPMVVLEGGLMVVETPSRKNAGAHYTPKALAEEVVLHALEPLVFSPGPYQTPNRDEWVPLSADALLELKVADIACGSGAFLVAAARYLADRLVESWQRDGRAADLLDKWASQGLDERESRLRLRTAAIREVVAQCLYGADINGMAVEMCKLSLWLVSLDPRKPFSFVDDKVFQGNSLLGLTSLRQLEELHIDPRPAPAHEQTQMEFRGNVLEERLDLRHKIDKAAQLRRRLAEEIAEDDPQRSAAAKHRQMEQLDELTRDLTTIADGVIAAGLPLGGKPGRKLDEAYENLRVAAGRAYPRPGEDADSFMLDSIVDRGLTIERLSPGVEADQARWQPLHWCLAVPEVMSRGGFDAVIGNPPFLGGQKLTGAMGTPIRDWLVSVLAGGAKGSADLAAYFFLRAMSLLRTGGDLGLIATNTIAQGGTREVGLDRMVNEGFTITRAIQSRSWPARSASLAFSGVWGTSTTIPSQCHREADGIRAGFITSSLEPAGRLESVPFSLPENKGRSFQGCILVGAGFLLSLSEGERWLADDPPSRSVLRKYMNGRDLNSSPTMSPGRYVIDFFDSSEAESRRYMQAHERLRLTVKPERELNARRSLKEKWWQFAEKRPAMRAALSNLDSAIVCAQTSATQAFVRVSTETLFDQAVVVIAEESFSVLGLLNSSIHKIWAVAWGSTRTGDPVYTPSSIFLTFPFAKNCEPLRRVGQILHDERNEIMLRRDLGLTKLYNLVNDPTVADEDDVDMARMRAIQTELDHVVMEAYGWGDVELNHGFHAYRQMTRWTVCPEARVEILDRLLEENHRRAALQDGAPPATDDETNESEGSDD